MTRLTDGTRTVEIEMARWNGTGFNPDWSMDFFEVGGLPYDEEADTYKVDDVDYCIDQAIDAVKEMNDEAEWLIVDGERMA